MTLFVGIDGGGTKTAAIATDEMGTELARAVGSATLVRAGAAEAGAAALADLVERVLRAAGSAPPARSICCALAGAGREAERNALGAALFREAIAERIRIITDAEAALFDAFGDGPGILVVAGTGSIAWGRAEDGRTARTGGWGGTLGDEGSGYALGLGALRAAAMAHDGRGQSTRLLDVTLRHTGVESPEGLIAWTAHAAKGEIAALAPTVVETAEEGDAVAAALVSAAVTDLVDHVHALYRRLGPWSAPPTIAPSGGLVAPGRPLREAFVSALQDGPVPFPILERTVDPARGAAAIARTATMSSVAVTP